ncbi:MAG: DMT family transporter [Patescibacteria group bacterium]
MNNATKGIMLALATAFFSGTNNFLTKIAVTALKDPILSTTLRNALVGATLVGIILLTKRWKELISLKSSQALQLLFIAVIGGCVPFILYFTGLSMIPALSAAFIHKTLFLWAAIFAVPLLKEHIGITQIAALLLLFGGNLALGFPKFNFNIGEALVLMATVFWALENVVAKKALANISSLTVAGARMAVGSLFLFLILALKDGSGAIVHLNAMQWGWTLLTALLLLGYVTTWYSALKKLPVTVATALLVPATLITNVMSGIFITHSITLPQVYNGVLVVLGSTLLIWGTRKLITPLVSRNSPHPSLTLREGDASNLPS